MTRITSEEIYQEVLHHLREVAHLGDDDMPEPDSDLLDEGYVDSMMLVSFVVRLESRFGIRFTDADIANPRSTTLAGITDIVVSRA